MDKIYLVVETYGFDGEDALTINAFKTKEKAKKYFDSFVNREKNTDEYKIAIAMDLENCNENCYIEENEDDEYYYCYNGHSFSETQIMIVEKDII